MGRRPLAGTLVLSLLVSVACSASVRTRVLRGVFDGVPEPGARVAEQATARQPGLPTPLPAAPASPPALSTPAEPVIPPAPFEALRSWDAVRLALPIHTDGGVDWVQAFKTGLVTPKLLPRTAAPVERPLGIDTVFDAIAGDPRRPALELDVRITPSVNRAFEGAALYEVTFPHGSHTAWVGCASCHPGVQASRTDMRGILEGNHCGRCHGKVSFAPAVSCSRCHTKLAPLAPAALAEEVAGADREPVAASPALVERGQALYLQACAICHGSAGDGKGPLSEPLDPKPRDFTAGKYKFRTTLPSSIPTDVDILATITRGVPGTSMPAFAVLSRDDRWALTHYIKTLSEKFTNAQPQPIPVAAPPEVTQAVLDMGLDLYTQAGCNSCHGDRGRGDGPSAAALKDDWGNLLRPFNFASGRPLKGGSGSDAVYRTLMTGFQGTPMPGFGDALTAEQGWALASYVLTLFDQQKEPFAVRGDVAFVRSEAAKRVEGANDYPPVVFPHWFHRVRVKCASCHPRVFEMRAGANATSMAEMRKGKFCATCHNGTAAWEIGFPTCGRCHLTPGTELSAIAPPMPAHHVAGDR